MLTYLRTKKVLGAILSPAEPMPCPVPDRHQKLWMPGLSTSDRWLHYLLNRLLQVIQLVLQFELDLFNTSELFQGFPR